MDVYAQAMMSAKRAAQSKLVRMVLQERKQEDKNAAAPSWTFSDVWSEQPFFASAQKKWRDRRDSNPRPLL
jgi:hypothetical protein